MDVMAVSIHPKKRYSMGVMVVSIHTKKRQVYLEAGHLRGICHLSELFRPERCAAAGPAQFMSQ